LNSKCQLKTWLDDQSIDIVKAVFSIDAFLRAENQDYSKKFLNEIWLIVESIVTINLRSVTIRRSTDCIIQWFNFLESSSFFKLWAIDRLVFLRYLQTFFQSMIEFRIFQTYQSFLSTISEQQRDTQNSQKSSSTATTSNRASINEISKSSTSQHNCFREESIDSLSWKSSSLSRESSSLQRRQRIISNIIIEQSQCSFIIIESTRKTSTKKTIFSQLLKAARSRVELNFKMTASFNDAQMTALQAMMQEIFQINNHNMRIDDNEENSDDNDENSDTTDDESDFNSQWKKWWNSSDVEFFDFNYKDSFKSELMIHIDKKTIFRDVHLFNERVKNIAVIKDKKMIAENLYIYLRDIALRWYVFKLTDMKKRLFKLSLDKWHWALLSRFKKSSAIALITITTEKYTMSNVYQRRKSREYAQIILRKVRSAEMISIYNQLFLIYNEIDLKLRRDLKSFKLKTMINAWLQQLNQYKEMWFDLVMRDRQRSFNSIEWLFNNVFNIIFIKERNQQSNKDQSDDWNSDQYSSNFQPNFQW